MPDTTPRSTDRISFSRVNHPRRVLLILLLLQALMLISSCVSQGVAIVGKVEFNPVLRRDLAPLNDKQKNNNISPFYADGNQPDSLINEMYPVPRGIPNSVFAQLRRSDFYYAAPGEPMRISWEVVAELHPNGVRSCNTNEVAACTVGDRVTREPWMCDGSTIATPEWDRTVPLALNLQTCNGPAPADRFAALQKFDQACSTLTRACATQTINYPFCAIDCEVPSVTGTYRLNLTLATLPPMFLSKELKPTVTVLEPGAILNRQLQPDDGPDPLPSPGVRIVSWSTEPRADETWEENYSPSFSVSSVQVIARNRSTGQAGTIDTRHMHIFRKGTNQTLRVATCDPDPGLRGYSARTCRQLLDSNPAYKKDSPAEQLIWKFEVPELNVDGSQNFTSETELFMEFTLTGPMSTSGALRSAQTLLVDPQVVHLGALPLNVDTRATNRVKLINPSTRSFFLRRVRNYGRNGQLAVELPGNRSFPFEVFPGTEVPLTLVVRPDPNEAFSRSATFTYDDGNVNAPVEITFGVSGTAYASSLALAPAGLNFNEPGEQHYVLVICSGYAPCTVTGAEITGAGAANFTLVSPWQFPVKLASYDRQQMHIQYNWRHDWNRLPGLSSSRTPPRATVTVRSSVGDANIPLTGAPMFDDKSPTRMIIISPKADRWWK